jgi:HTH-type transcriptional regulator / antitoxin HigA
MADHKIRIENAAEYDSIMKEIDGLMKKGEANLTDAETKKLRSMAVAAQTYEASIYTIR